MSEQSIMAKLSASPAGMTAKELAKELGESTAIVQEDLQAMATAGVLTQRRVGRDQVFALAKRATAPMAAVAEPASPEPVRGAEAPRQGTPALNKPTMYSSIGGTLTLDISSGPVAVRFDSVVVLNRFLDDLIDAGRAPEKAAAEAAITGRGEWPHGATVKLRWVGSNHDDGKPGWAKRDAQGRLVSVYSLTLLDPDCWNVVEERTFAPETHQCTAAQGGHQP